MDMEVLHRKFCRLASAGTVVAAVALASLSAAYAQEDDEGSLFPRRRTAGRGSDGILQILDDEMTDSLETTTPPPVGAKVEPEGDGPPAGTNPDAPTPPAPWSLTDIFNDADGKNWLKDNQWKIGGNIDQSFTGNFSSPRDRWNGPVTWTDRSNEYELNQFWLYIERATDTTKQDFDIGGRFDAFFGSNYRFDTETGLENNNFRFNSQHTLYGFALPQFYLETAYKKLKIKWGHFISPVGYFTVDMTQNFFNTLPYTFQYGEPFTHTGALATYTVDDHLTLGGGVVRGWDNFDGSGTGTKNLAPIVQATYTWEDKSSLYYFGIYSNEANSFGTDVSPRWLQTVVYSKPLSEKWNYVFQSDLGIQQDTNNASNPGGISRWYGVNQYFFYVQNEKWTWGVNLEWFRDEEGFRVGGFLPVPPSTPQNSSVEGLPTTRSGFAGNFFQTTMGPKWQFHKNMFLRPNLRFDYFDGNANVNGLLPFGDGNKHWQGILATDLAIVF
jgi:hypothetical protein